MVRKGLGKRWRNGRVCFWGDTGSTENKWLIFHEFYFPINCLFLFNQAIINEITFNSKHFNEIKCKRHKQHKSFFPGSQDCFRRQSSFLGSQDCFRRESSSIGKSFLVFCLNLLCFLLLFPSNVFGKLNAWFLFGFTFFWNLASMKLMSLPKFFIGLVDSQSLSRIVQLIGLVFV